MPLFNPGGGTVAGGPPSGSGSFVGQQIQDTTYGVIWWWDGSAWHANGTGLIHVHVHLTSAPVLGTGTIIVPVNSVDDDPLSQWNAAGHYWACPLTGWYMAAGAITFDLNNGTQTMQSFLYDITDSAIVLYGSSWTLTSNAVPAGDPMSSSFASRALLTAGHHYALYMAQAGGNNVQMSNSSTYLDLCWSSS